MLKLLRPLPFEEPDRLVRLFHVPPPNAFPGMPTFPVSPANFYDWKRDAQLQQLVFGVSPSDPLTLAAVAGTLAVVALLASLVPADRASKLDPLEVLRGTSVLCVERRSTTISARSSPESVSARLRVPPPSRAGCDGARSGARGHGTG